MADFGLSRKIVEASSKIFGIIPYVDPKCFSNDKNQSENYKLSKKSDVYSIGVLMWQVSSGRRPFEDQGANFYLQMDIQRGKREEIIHGTPTKYSNLYNTWFNIVKEIFLLTLFI